jgi:hypothetical protein
MTTRLVVNIARPIPGKSIETRVFAGAPVSVGSSAASLLRLQHPSIAPERGVLIFTAATVHYIDYAAGTSAVVDGLALTPGIPFALRPDSLIEIGPFRFCAEVVAAPGALPLHELPGHSTESETPVARQVTNDGFDPIVCAACGMTTNANTAALRSFLTHAMKLADIISAVVIELRARQARTGLRSFETSLLRTSWDHHEISSYLLGPGFLLDSGAHSGHRDHPDRRIVIT